MTPDHTAREMAIAREVQGRLLPQEVPQLANLDVAARCIQARSVGGDFYDFFELGPQTGFALADVSGKGFHAALVMVSLQAHLRSQFSVAPQDPLRVLREVNKMVWKSTGPGHYATLFLGLYTEASRRLTYINCGHNPPIWLRQNGRADLLEATATVIGAFESWECRLGRAQLSPGDLVVAYSDGVTEASRDGELFGEERLLQAVRDNAERPAQEILDAVLGRVQEFGEAESLDDLTLMIARSR